MGGPHGQSVGSGLGIHPDEFAARLTQETESLRRGEEQAPEERRQQGGSALQCRLPGDLRLPSQHQPTRSELLIAIAEAANLNLISNAYTKPKEGVPGLARRTVEDAMEIVCARHGCFWRAEHGALLVRSRYWWLDDLDEPPATQAARWQATLEKDGRLRIDDASQIAALPPAQRGRLALRLPETRDAWNPWLRLYGQLTVPQRQAAEMPQGLPLAAIPLPLRLEIIDEPTPKVNPRRLDPDEALSKGRMALRVTREAQDQDRPAAIFLLQPLPNAEGRRQGQIESMAVPLPCRKPQASAPPLPGSADMGAVGL